MLDSFLNENETHPFDFPRTSKPHNSNDPAHSVLQQRKSLQDNIPFNYTRKQVTPISSLFIRPDSPQFSILNTRMKELHHKFETEIEVATIGKGKEKIVKVQTTMASSLMLRRNQSEKTVKLKPY